MTQTDQTTPFTILTGFLGAGKTTLLNHLLSAKHNQRLAVIVNEFGAINIDSQLVTRRHGDSMVEMSNGCVCCTVQQDLLDGLKTLLSQKHDRYIDFDQIILETTGMAKVGPIIQTIALKDLKTELHLGSVITVVDALHAQGQLDEFEEAQEQVGLANLILLNKADLVSREHLETLSRRLSNMNALARIKPTQQGQITIVELLFPRDPEVQPATNATTTTPPHEHTHEHHSHADAVHSFTIETLTPLDHGRVQDWLSFLIMRHTENLLRYKGILNISERSGRIVLQGVHAQIAVTTDRDWRPGEERKSQLVFIGKNLPEQQIREEFETCFAPQHA